MSRVIPLVAMLLLALVGGGGVAHAHSELVSTSPEDGQVLEAPPTEVTFTFSEDLLPDFVSFVATSASGEVTDLVVIGVDGPTSVVAWPTEAPGGEWRVDYRVVSADGHPVDGSITFSYVAESPSPSPTPTPSTPSPSPTTSSATPEPAPTSAEPSPSAVPASESSGPSTGWSIAIVGVVALIVIVVVGLVARRGSS